MEYLFDTANIDEIREYGKVIPITGVTSNPSIVKKEGKINFFAHLREIRKIIGAEKTLHVQVLGQTCDAILKDAEVILNQVDNDVYIKIPVTEEGLKAIRILKERGVNITATAIYSKAQGFLAMEVGADYIAPYYNRMENLNIDAREVIAAFSQMITTYGYKTKILAASFKNVNQVNEAYLAGAQTATMSVDVLKEAFAMPSIQKAVDDFEKDWQDVYGEGVTMPDLQ